MKRPDISIVIVNYNTPELTLDCIASLKKVTREVSFEIVVVDNGSTSDDVLQIRKKYPDIRLITSKTNLGFARGNNLAKDVVSGKYILFLNSDTIVHPGTLKKSIHFIESQKNKVGAVTCKVLLKNGKLDPDTRRSFPTPWVSFTHLVLRLDVLFPHSKLFSKYWYGYIPDNITHEVDVIQGAFMLIPKDILDRVGWFDESYFLDGEDIDLCWKIKELGYSIYYYHLATITHLKGSTKGKNSTFRRNTPLGEILKYRMTGVNSMEIFYRKHMWKKYPLILNLAVLLGIRVVKVLRFIKAVVKK